MVENRCSTTHRALKPEAGRRRGGREGMWVFADDLEEPGMEVLIQHEVVTIQREARLPRLDSRLCATVHLESDRFRLGSRLGFALDAPAQ